VIEYYNVLDSGYDGLKFSAMGLIMVAIGIVVIFLMKKFGTEKSKMNFMYFWTGFGILWTVVAFIFSGAEYIESIYVIKTGNYMEVEGIVEDFDPMPFSGHKNESFTVNGIFFEYSDFGPSAGFNNTKSHGGPIDENKYVKIRYNDGLILQLWVKE